MSVVGTTSKPVDARPPKSVPVGELQARRAEILAQLSRIVEDHSFKHSRHYTALLRYVVEQTLEGRTTHLKERVLGSEVFGRDPGYDTNQDPVVRTSACEIRKRLAVYYLNPDRSGEIRIDLPSGSYVPEIQFPEAVKPLATEQEAPKVEEPAEPVRPSRPSRSFRRLRYAWAAIPLAGVSAVIGLSYLNSPERALERFWGPVWGGSGSVMLCVSEFTPGQAAPADSPPATSANDLMLSDRIPFPDALTAARVVGLLREHGKGYEIRKVRNSALVDLRKGPVVLIGGISNPWTVRLQERERFTFRRTGNSGVVTVWDRDNPTQWSADLSKPYSELREDYAIVSRFRDSVTGSMVVIVAGLGKDGAAAGGEFVTDPAHLAELNGRAKAGWKRKSIQAVIATSVVDGDAGRPRILATEVW